MNGRTGRRILPFALVLLAAALRFYHLGDKSLWGDEIAMANWAVSTLGKLWAQFRDPPDFLLQLLAIHYTIQIGPSEFWVRLPSAAASVLAVPVTYVAARRMWGSGVGLVGMFLIAISPEQIWYAQDARMYAAQALFGVLALYFFLRLLTAPDWRGLVGLTAANVLGAYNHLFGFIPPLIEGLAVLAFGLPTLAHYWRTRTTGIRRVADDFPRWLMFAAASLALTFLLILPLLSGTFPYLLHPVAKAEVEAAFQTTPFQVTPQFLRLLASDFGLGPDNGWRTVLSLGLAVTGVFALAKRAPRFGAYALVWLALPLFLLQLSHPLHTVANRYLIFMQPVYLILIAGGIVYLLSSLERFQGTPVWRTAGYGLLGVGFVWLIAAPPLQALYARAKLNDWGTLANYLASHAEPGDVLVGEKDYWSIRSLGYYLPNLNAFSSPPGTVQDLQNALDQHRRIWYVSFGGLLNREAEAWVKQNLTPVDPAVWERSDLKYDTSDGFTFTESEPLVTVYRHDDVLPAKIQYTAELGEHKDVRPFLPIVPGDLLEAKLSLPVQTRRALKLDYTGQGAPGIRVTLGTIALEHGVRKKEQGGAKTLTWAVPDTLPETVTLRIKNIGMDTLRVRAVSLYASDVQ